MPDLYVGNSRESTVGGDVSVEATGTSSERGESPFYREFELAESEEISYADVPIMDRESKVTVTTTDGVEGEYVWSGGATVHEGLAVIVERSYIEFYRRVV